MKLYIWIIGVATAILAVVAAIVAPMVELNRIYAAGMVVVSVLAVIAVDAVIAWIVHAMPGKYYTPERLPKITKAERRFYEKIGVRRWKDILPEAGGMLCDFSKTQVADPTDPEYLYQFLIETGYAGVMHFLSAPLGFLILLIPFGCWWLIPLPVAIVNFFLQLPFPMIQRYNRPKLQAAYKRALRTKEAKRAKEAAEEARANTEAMPQAEQG